MSRKSVQKTLPEEETLPEEASDRSELDKEIQARQAIRVEDVMTLTGWSRANVYKKIANGEFPGPMSLGHRLVWPQNMVFEWLEKQTGAPPEPTAKKDPLPEKVVSSAPATLQAGVSYHVEFVIKEVV